MVLFKLVIVLVLSAYHVQAEDYIAAVFESYVLKNDTPDTTIRKNIESYRQFADDALKQKATILVFPEYGLTTLVKDPEQYAQEINDSNEIIEQLKAMATEHGVYMVVNVLEKEQEANKKTKYYNTNLVFGRDGEIILKYRKINLYDEPKLTPGDANQTLTFTTDFGVTFGVFTGFDIYFNNPSRQVLDDAKVTDIVYPTAWSSRMPFHTALTAQHGYAIGNGVNLLAANYGRPREGHGGSGIYLANGKIAEVYIDDSSSSKRIVQSVAKISKRQELTICNKITPFGLPDNVGRSNVTDFKTSMDFDAEDYVFKNVDLSVRNSSIEVCHGDFCCTFTIIVDQTSVSSEYYKVMAFDGIVDVKDSKYHTRTCSLVACETESSDSCGKRINSTSTRFTKLKVEGQLKNEEGTFYVPLSLNAFLMPLSEVSFCNNHNATDTAYVKFETVKAANQVLVFGLFGKTINGASSIQIASAFGLVLFSLVKNFLF